MCTCECVHVCMCVCVCVCIYTYMHVHIMCLFKCMCVCVCVQCLHECVCVCVCVCVQCLHECVWCTWLCPINQHQTPHTIPYHRYIHTAVCSHTYPPRFTLALNYSHYSQVLAASGGVINTVCIAVFIGLSCITYMYMQCPSCAFTSFPPCVHVQTEIRVMGTLGMNSVLHKQNRL